jgi:hypothetical protein
MNSEHSTRIVEFVTAVTTAGPDADGVRHGNA